MDWNKKISKIKEIKNKINEYIKNNKIKELKLIPNHYEKDSLDINVINFMCYSSNLRAKNYDIPQLNSMKIKIIVGKIIPSIITNTSSIAELLALQIYVLFDPILFSYYKKKISKLLIFILYT